MKLLMESHDCLLAKNVHEDMVILSAPSEMMVHIEGSFVCDNGPVPKCDFKLFTATLQLWGDDEDGEIRVCNISEITPAPKESD